MSSGRCIAIFTDPAFGAASRVSVTCIFGVSLSSRYGYCEYALYVIPPPQGFSQASFSSSTTVRKPARANPSAAVAPAGPPPNTTTVFIFVVPAACLTAAWVARCRRKDVRAANPAREDVPAADPDRPTYCRIPCPANRRGFLQPSARPLALTYTASPCRDSRTDRLSDGRIRWHVLRD